MKTFLIRITMQDGSVGRHAGLYRDGCSAVIAALDAFPDARRISALRSLA
jgi:hypothetical protein